MLHLTVASGLPRQLIAGNCLQVKLPLVATSSSALNSARSESGTPKSSKSKTPRTERSAHERSPRRKTRRSDNSECSRENYNSLAGAHICQVPVLCSESPRWANCRPLNSSCEDHNNQSWICSHGLQFARTSHAAMTIIKKLGRPLRSSIFE